MGFISRLLHPRDEEPKEASCPRCGAPAPATANDCSACGWDLRESFSGAYVSSHLTGPPR